MAAKPVPTLTTALFIAFVSISTTVLVPIVQSLPFVVFHGILSSCDSQRLTEFTRNLTKWSGSQGYCIEIGDGVGDSFLMPVMKQATIACEKVKGLSALKDGYSIVAISQGNMIGRGVVEFCDGAPSVKNFVSLAGPHAGVASVPYCGSDWRCKKLAELLEKHGIYSKYIQHISEYLRGATFLPNLNNEVTSARNSMYKNRFASLENLVLIMDENDTVLIPKETSWFGFYEDGSFEKVLPANETKLYTEDWIGLKKLMEAGKVKFVTVTGDHATILPSDMKKYIVPYLNAATKLP